MKTDPWKSLVFTIFSIQEFFVISSTLFVMGIISETLIILPETHIIFIMFWKRPIYLQQMTHI